MHDIPTAEPPHQISATAPDWTREHKRFFEWTPSRSLLASLRSYQRHARAPGVFHAVMRRVAVLRHTFWSVITGSDIPLNCRIDGGLLLPHPNGVVVHPDCRVGPNCLLFQQVTLAGGRGGAPRVHGHVEIGAGAKVIGGVTLGPHCVIGANAVVLTDVPAGATAVGIPARVVLPVSVRAPREASIEKAPEPAGFGALSDMLERQ